MITIKHIIIVFLVIIIFMVSPYVNGLTLGTKYLENNQSIIETVLEKISYIFIQNYNINHQKNKICLNEKYDLLIICPKIFENEVKPLQHHKNNHAIKTQIITTEEIYDTYSSFNNKLLIDRAEQIKHCIKDYYDNYGISYVLLIGGLKSGFKGWLFNPTNEKNWHVPGRYSNLDLDGFPEKRYLCDLYFADLYDSDTHSIFQTWNTDVDGNDAWFGEWRYQYGLKIIDQRDLIPDVAIGRLPCRNNSEVQIIIDKIITYEETTYGKDWFNNVILVGGDSLNDNIYEDNQVVKKGIIEGKYACKQAYRWMLNRHSFFNTTFFPQENSSKSDLNDSFFPMNYFNEQKNGSGFTYLVGHGNKGWWCNHPRHGDHLNFSYIRCYPQIINGDNLTNDFKFPVLVLDGCHMCDFSMNYYNNYWISRSPRCFGYLYLSWKEGGSIASIGNTAICYGKEGKRYLNEYDGCIYSRFFEEYGNGTDDDRLGDYLCRVITHYIEKPYSGISQDEVRNNILHTKCIESTVLLGDPSLKIGGYGPQDLL